VIDKSPSSVLYLATFDPTVSATGTATRGKLFLRFFSENYEVFLVHMKEKHEDGKDKELIERLANITTIDYSNLEYFTFSPKFYRAACKALEKKKFDFIFADFEKSGWYAYLLSQKYRLPYIYNSHNVEYLRYIDFAKRNPIRYPFVPYMYAVERIACQNALFTVAISEKDAETFRAWVPSEKVFVMPSAFDETLFNPFYEEIKTQEPIILMVGNYRNPGNRDGAYLLRDKIVPGVLQRFPKAIFRCIGKDFPSDIKHPNIEVLGFVDDLVTEYKKATAVIVPITIGGGIKIKTIEGLACGKFVISTSKGVEGIDTYNLANLQIVPMDGFANCIIEVLSKPMSKTTRNWERIERCYGTRYQLYSLKEKIDSVLRN
jgi:polysaccharide biosynthesis protein PslH